MANAQGLAGDGPAKFLGVQSCASSGCHGGAKDDFNQVAVWEKLDFHTRSYATLTTARSAQIGRALKIVDVTQDARCTTCHAPMHEVPASLRHESIKVIQGVSCENCHGPAEPWLRTHTRADLTHAEKVAVGMRDLRDFYVRANTCVACHQTVEPALQAAGHPELIFELDGQCVTEPRHWRERRPDAGPALWLTGQGAALREMSWQLARQNDLPSQRDMERQAALEWLLAKFGLAAAENSQRGESKPPRFAATQISADALARSAANAVWDPTRIPRELSTLAGSHREFEQAAVSRSQHARRAERLVLALDRLAMAGPAERAAKLKAELDALFRAVQSVADFEPAKFARLLKEFEAKLNLEIAAGGRAPESQPK